MNWSSPGYRLNTARALANEFHWGEICHQENILMVSFMRGDARLNVYYSTMTVATVVTHPKHGRNQMYRRRVGYEILRSLFKNPRSHTFKLGVTGYHVHGKHLDTIKKRGGINAE